jgi:hypothetical protein
MSASRESKVAAHILAEVTFKPHSAGGRPMMPVGSGYAPYLRSGLTSEALAVRVNNVPAGAQFGQAINVTIELSYYPKFDYGALAEGLPIQLVEGPKVVAEGICRSPINNSGSQ